MCKKNGDSCIIVPEAHTVVCVDKFLLKLSTEVRPVSENPFSEDTTRPPAYFTQVWSTPDARHPGYCPSRFHCPWALVGALPVHSWGRCACWRGDVPPRGADFIWLDRERVSNPCHLTVNLKFLSLPAYSIMNHPFGTHTFILFPLGQRRI